MTERPIAAAETVIVDYGMGNLKSVLNKFNRLEIPARVSADPNTIAGASKLILPGVGHFKKAMDELRARGLLDILNQRVLEDKIPIMGICLGMQLFMESSDEGDAEGLGWIKGRTIHFRTEELGDRLKVPHMGWSGVDWTRSGSLNAEADPASLYYFVHAYHVVCEDRTDVLGTSHYGYTFDVAVQRDNIFGTQFHPEKSHHQGRRLIANFASL